MIDQLRLLVRRVLPVSTRRAIIRYTRWPPVRLIWLGSLRRLKPISPYWGWERGLPIDRYYIEKFLAAHSEDVCGQVLEIGANMYTVKYGGDKVIQSSVLHIAEQKEFVTIIGDLTNAENIPSNSFDCLIVTQTLQAIYEVEASIRTIHRILKPGGTCLATVPGISKISRYDMDRWGYYWSFTTRSIRNLFETVFPPEHLQVKAYGNVLASVAFLHGLATSELRKKELEYLDPDYELLITIRAQKPVETR
jgi:SAM-dependent methyltransferase